MMLSTSYNCPSIDGMRGFAYIELSKEIRASGAQSFYAELHLELVDA
jgi:hypothetical protein